MYGIYANIGDMFDGIHVTIYSSTMDPMGLEIPRLLRWFSHHNLIFCVLSSHASWHLEDDYVIPQSSRKMWVKQCHLHHLPVITMFIGGINMHKPCPVMGLWHCFTHISPIFPPSNWAFQHVRAWMATLKGYRRLEREKDPWSHQPRTPIIAYLWASLSTVIGNNAVRLFLNYDIRMFIIIYIYINNILYI